MQYANMMDVLAKIYRQVRYLQFKHPRLLDFLTGVAFPLAVGLLSLKLISSGRPVNVEKTPQISRDMKQFNEMLEGLKNKTTRQKIDDAVDAMDNFMSPNQYPAKDDSP